MRTINDLTTLRKFETDPEACVDRLRSTAALSARLQEETFSKMDAGTTLHDKDLQGMARAINQEINMLRFDASLRWIQNFKQSHAIVSRRVTKFSSRRSRLGEDASRQAGDNFVEETRRVIIDQNFEPQFVVNADQSGLTKQ